MTRRELIAILQTLPEDSFDVIVTGREQHGRKSRVTASIPASELPGGWAPCAEPACQQVTGTRRVIWAGQAADLVAKKKQHRRTETREVR